jgi:hypothetical protein
MDPNAVIVLILRVPAQHIVSRASSDFQSVHPLLQNPTKKSSPASNIAAAKCEVSIGCCPFDQEL